MPYSWLTGKPEVVPASRKLRQGTPNSTHTRRSRVIFEWSLPCESTPEIMVY